jgi:hypothetical protein
VSLRPIFMLEKSRRSCHWNADKSFMFRIHLDFRTRSPTEVKEKKSHVQQQRYEDRVFFKKNVY